MEHKFAHHVYYNSKLKLFKIMLLISFLISILSALYMVFYHVKIPFLFILSITLFISFIIVYLILYVRARAKGNYEGIDIIDNKIEYYSEKFGEKTFTPGDIESMRIYKYTHHNNDAYNYVKIKTKDSTKEFTVPYSVSDYAGLVRKMKSFKASNNILG